MAKVLADRYEIIEKIGEGGMAVVYRAKDILLGREVAIKILRPEFIDNEVFIKSFKRESQAAAALSHQNIVSTYDVGEDGNIYYIVMEYIKGQTLKEIIDKEAPIAPKTVVAIGKQICEALIVAHKHGIIHRDIKPHNIMINDEGIVKIADFGIAKAVNNATIVTSPGMVVGSVHYFSPEQAKGSVVDAKSDIYSTGVVLYEMLTGQVPFTADNPVTIAVMHMNDKAIPPSELVSGIPVDLQDIILRALEKYPINRFSSARSMYEALSRIDFNNIVVNKYDNSSDDMDKTKAVFIPASIPIDKTEDEEDDYEPEYEKRPNRNLAKNPKKQRKKNNRLKKIAAISAVVVGALLLALLVFFLYNKFMTVKNIKVPDVIGLSEAKAIEVLEDKKFKIEIGDFIESDEFDEGQIGNQDPRAAETVKEGATITLNIVTGKTITVPDLSNLQKEEAVAKIGSAGYEVGDITEEYSDSIEKDYVISQSPETGEVLDEGKSISLVISKGKEKKKVKMPDLIKMSKKQAKTLLESLNLKLNKVTKEYTSKYEKGDVMWQQYAEGYELTEGDSVNIRVSKGEEPITSFSYTISYSNAPAATFDLKVRLTANGTTTTIVPTETVNKSDKGKKVTLTGSGTGYLYIYFNGGDPVESRTVNFADKSVS
ncbi:MAG: Stk1 family PASTA domain-containing Ser/Thr kinase [Clostridiales Family XIII bacterium]|jgi:serine/threonine-protein kinase|nr:Stk1 family PASTA domain-containing Ser/Thr kinase [Clostridiales Family XIII bacterium]